MLPRISGAAALLHKDRNSKRTSGTKSQEATTIIARYVYPDRGESIAAAGEAAPFLSNRWRGSMSRTSGARSLVQGAGPDRQRCQRARRG
jgi:hypothetical protein